MNEIKKFEIERENRVKNMGNNERLKNIGPEFISLAETQKYSYNFSWMGRPIIQYPQDILAMQEIIWDVKPDLIIETGIAHGGSLIFYASILELIGKGEVLGIDIDIRSHNKEAIENHPMFKRISMIEGSSTDENIVKQAKEFTIGKEKILVTLDSNHTHEHVLKELELYSPLVTKGSYLVVYDTIVEDMPENAFPNRPWGKGNNPKTAVWEFLEKNNSFEVDKSIENKLLITVAPDGYLKKY
ncbi:MAG: cephalosporin hydroxylase family protein [Desulfobacter sp.]|nr:MAG: cephalosporin hydroxylase family protein [Desulfobacter sp.]